MKRTILVALMLLLSFAGGFFARPVIEARFIPPYKSLALSHEVSAETLPAQYRDLLVNPVLQRGGALCGPASLQAILQTFDREVDQQILLDQSSSISSTKVEFGGMTLDELADLAQEHDLNATVVRPSTLEALRASLSTLHDQSKRVIVNYSRMPLTGENIGHHTPVVLFDSQTDSVVLNDVTPGYGSYKVPLFLLLAAIQTADSETGQPRGLLLLEESQ